MKRITLALLSIVFSSPVWAQDATLSGLVTDSTNAVIPGAHVTLRNQDTGVLRNAQSNADGSYSIRSLGPGPYGATVEATGFTVLTVNRLILEVDQNARLDFHLRVGSQAESVQVSGSGANINTTDATVSTVIDQTFVENVPLNGRSLQPLITLSPGVSVVPSAGGVGYSGEITVNGQRTEANYYTVDGVSGNTGAFPDNEVRGAGYSGSVPSETIAGTTQSLVSLDALQEFRASTSTYSAEYGRTPGGQFSFSTRSGTNNLHGNIFEFFRNDVFDANSWFNNHTGLKKTAERQNDFGGTLGGPVTIPGLYSGKDKTFFFASYEGLRLRTPQAALPITVPDLQLRKDAAPALRPILNAAPSQNLVSDGLNDGIALYNLAYSAPSNVDNGSLRIDENLNDKLHVFARYSDTPSHGYIYDPDGFQESREVTSRGVTAGLTYLVRPSITNELRFNFTRAAVSYARTELLLDGGTPFDNNSLPGANGQPLSAFRIILDFGASAIVQAMHSDASQHQINLVDSVTWHVRNHNLKAGVDWRRLGSTVDPITAYENVDFLSRDSIVSGIADTISNLPKSQVTPRPVYNNYSTFVQDEWRMTNRLSASLGLRWDINPAPSDSGGNLPYTVDQISNIATVRVAPKGTPLWKTRWTGFAPRVGFAYQLNQSPNRQTVVRAGFGLFYDTGNSGAADGYRGIGVNAVNTYSKTAFPLTSAQLQLSAPNTTAPYGVTVYGFDPQLSLPRTLQWNLSVEQALGANQTVTLGYVASSGQKLLSERQYVPNNDFGNTNFQPNVGLLAYFNGSSSDYHSLQAKFQRRLSAGLQTLVSYTWSHSTDLASSNFVVYNLQRASSDFDIRHNLEAAITYELPSPKSGGVFASPLRHWSLDTRITARTALPFTIYGATQQVDAAQGSIYYAANLVPSTPLYVYGSQYPGGRAFNFSAFTSAPVGTQGNAPRNLVRGFGAAQADLALQRIFPVGDSFRVLLRGEAFNLTNHPSFGNVENRLYRGANSFGLATGTLDTQLGGLNSLYQTGAARSLQLALKLQF